ncbi:hypothetical protein [Poriferisphaera sp. WC338]|uniref:hypothetical protein n=1 Tax=Poriferisphaera sp. WC338 TaxID=3425129 RepID=UPI003D81371C
MMRMLRFRLTCVVILLASFSLVTGYAWAEEAKLTTNENKLFKGEIKSQSAAGIVMTVDGEDMPFDWQNIKRISTLSKVELKFTKVRAGIKNSDHDARYDFVLDVYDQQLFKIAEAELRSLIKLEPKNRKYNRLMRVIENELNSQTDKPSEPVKPASQTTTKPKSKPQPKASKPTYTVADAPPLLTEEDVSLIRLWELPANILASKPIVTVQKKTIDRFFDEYRESEFMPKGKRKQNSFRKLRGYEQLDVFFNAEARSLYRGIKVHYDPPSMRYWRKNLNVVYVAQYFQRQFGRGQIPGLVLLKRRPKSDQEAYTNFLILNEAQNDGKPFINREEPEKSLLLQWGLPREEAVYPAPEQSGWKPYFSKPDDPRFKRAVAWIKGLYKPKPDYGVKSPVPPVAGSKSVAGADENKTKAE